MATKINTISLPKKLKGMKPNTMVGIPKDQVAGVLPLLNKLSFPISREYEQGNLIVTRTA